MERHLWITSESTGQTAAPRSVSSLMSNLGSTCVYSSYSLALCQALPYDPRVLDLKAWRPYTGSKIVWAKHSFQGHGRADPSTPAATSEG